MEYSRSIEEITETLGNAKARGKGCSLLIGAGCSVKAGIPTAPGLVEVIKERYPMAYGRAGEEKTYPKCMAELLISERRDLIAEYVDNAKLNWAHICIALLIQNGYVDRVLTTNFDLLVVRACALLREFPAVYDFAASQLYKAPDVPGKAVFYLHGQRTGFVLINTDDVFERHSKLLRPVFEDAGRGRAWIVVGYSGESDPVFDHLANVPQFDNGLFWIGYQNNEPGKHVRERLLISGKDAFYTNGYDADSFFIKLAQNLNIFPPDFIGRPFSHLDRTFEMLTPYTIPGQETVEDVTQTPRQWLKKAIETFEAEIPPVVPTKEVPISKDPGFSAWLQLMEGNYEGVLAYRDQYERTPTPGLADALSWAYIMQGTALSDQAKSKTGAEADRLFALAGEKYRRAEEIRPGSGAYNLACLCALGSDEEGCRKWLEKSKQLGTLPNRVHVMNDPDLESVREREWFQGLFVEP